MTKDYMPDMTYEGDYEAHIASLEARNEELQRQVEVEVAFKHQRDELIADLKGQLSVQTQRAKAYKEDNSKLRRQLAAAGEETKEAKVCVAELERQLAELLEHNPKARAHYEDHGP